MTRKTLDKDLLAELIIGGAPIEKEQQILETEEVKSLMYHQWKNPHRADTGKKPDYKKSLERIRAKIQVGKDIESSEAQFRISEINKLKQQNQGLRRQLRISIAVAASVILLIGVAAILILSMNTLSGEADHAAELPRTRKVYSFSDTELGQKPQMLLPDGTKVYLNSGTLLKYDNFFGINNRNLELVSGEAYFEVTPDKTLPFIISTEDVEVSVLGTKFNLMAYDNDDYVETVVTEGEVTVRDKNSNSLVKLKANQRATFDKKTGAMEKDGVKNPEDYISWKDNELKFDNENFGYIIKKLERWYDVSISVQGTDSIVDRYTMTIERESLREVLDLISRTTNIDYRIEEDTVTINYK